MHASAIFTGAEGIPGRRVHTSAIHRKVYPYRRVPASAMYRKVDPDKRVHALAIGWHHGRHGDEAHVVVPGRSDLRGKHPIFKRNVINQMR